MHRQELLFGAAATVTGSVIPVPKQRLCASENPGAIAEEAHTSVGVADAAAAGAGTGLLG